MKRKILFILCSIFITVGFASAQTAKRTLTNSDLQKFKEKRLQAEQNLRENYEKLGFPSPAEMEKQQKADDLERERLSEKLRFERLQREQLQQQQEYQQSPQYQQNPEVYYNQGSGGYGYYGSYPYISSGSYYGYPGYNNNFYLRGRYQRRGGNFYFGGRYGQNSTYLTGGGYFAPRFFPNQNQINSPGFGNNPGNRIRPPRQIRNPR